jgi:hypothetical protein
VAEGITAGLQWLRSSYSGSTGGHCVEAAADGGLVRIRHSKRPGGPQVSVTADTWQHFLARLLAGASSTGPGLVTAPGDDGIVLRDSRKPSGHSLWFSPAEWDMFRCGAADGEFDLTGDGGLAGHRTRPA